MIWPATWLGAAAGFVFASIPGALLGGLLGQLLDRQLRLPSWSALLGLIDRSPRLGVDELRFLLLGRLAKLHGRVLPAHIEQARNEMHRLKLDAQSEQLAISAFSRGKSAETNLHRPLRRLRKQRGEAQSLLLSCWRMVGAGGGATPQQRELIMLWGKWLGWSVGELEALTIGIGAGSARKPPPDDAEYRAALALLGVTPGSDAGAIKNAYRRLLSRNHPDKQAGAGASPEQLRLATEKTRDLHGAYRLIRERHGFR
jgi:DnaJ like chaperone protein